MNSVAMTAVIGKQIEARTTKTGKMYAFVSLGTKGYRKNETEWFDAIAWGKTAEALAKYTNVGDTIAFDNGRLSKSSYTDRNGNTVYQTRIVIGTFEVVSRGKVSRERIAERQAALAQQAPQPVQVPDEMNLADFELVLDEAELPF